MPEPYLTINPGVITNPAACPPAVVLARIGFLIVSCAQWRSVIRAMCASGLPASTAHAALTFDADELHALRHAYAEREGRELGTNDLAAKSQQQRQRRS